MANGNKARWSYADAKTAYYEYGTAALQEALDDKRLSRSVLRKAMKSVPEDKQGPIKAFFENLFGDSRGRSAPQVGEVRNYVAQKMKNGGPFIRIPAHHGGKGDIYDVKFLADGRFEGVMRSAAKKTAPTVVVAVEPERAAAE